jgi:hypothetical protein
MNGSRAVLFLTLATVSLGGLPGAAWAGAGDPATLSLSGRSSGEPLVGATANFGGDLEAYGRATGQPIVLEADRFPFDGAFERVAETTTDDTGGFDLASVLSVNARYRAVATALPERPVSGIVERTAQLGYVLRFRGHDRAPAVTAILRGPRAALHGRRLFVYRFRYRRSVGTRVGAITLRSSSDRRASGRTRLRLRRIPNGDSLVVCLREPRDDGIGPHSRLQRICGRSVIGVGGGETGLGILLPTLR